MKKDIISKKLKEFDKITNDFINGITAYKGKKDLTFVKENKEYLKSFLKQAMEEVARESVKEIHKNNRVLPKII